NMPVVVAQRFLPVDDQMLAELKEALKSSPASPTPPTPPDPALVAASVSFHTNDDDKDDDSILWTSIDRGNEAVAAIGELRGRYEDHHDQGPFAMIILKPVTKREIRNCVGRLRMQTNGKDTWRFNVTFTTLFADGECMTWH